MAQWTAHWTSRHVKRDIQRLWVRVPPESLFDAYKLHFFLIKRSRKKKKFSDWAVPNGQTIEKSLE